MSALNLTVRVHPLVLFQVVDAFERRNADSQRVIGTLLGKLQIEYKIAAGNRIDVLKSIHSLPAETGSIDKGVVEVTNCFCVPHKEHADQVEAELSYALDVYELNRRVNSSENIVGK